MRTKQHNKKCLEDKMVKTEINVGWKILIILTLLISSICLIILIPKPQYEYYTKLIEIDNTNTGYIDGKVVDYLCSDNVYVDGWSISDGWFYASTWRDGKVPHSKGECFVKVRRTKHSS